LNSILTIKYLTMFKPTLNVADAVIVLGLIMVGLAVHQKVVAPKLTKAA